MIRLSTPCKLLSPGSTSSSVTRRLLQKDRTQATSHRRSYLWLAVGKTEPNAAMKSGDQFHLTPPRQNERVTSFEAVAVGGCNVIRGEIQIR